MSESSYRDAAARLRAALWLLGDYRGPSPLGHPDARLDVADTLTRRLIGGESVRDLADETWPDLADGVERVHELVIAVLAADPYRHRMSLGRAAGIDRETWADLTPAAPVTQ